MPGPNGVVCPLGTQISFVSATMPCDLENILEEVVPVIVVLYVLQLKSQSCLNSEFTVDAFVNTCFGIKLVKEMIVTL